MTFTKQSQVAPGVFSMVTYSEEIHHHGDWPWRCPMIVLKTGPKLTLGDKPRQFEDPSNGHDF